MGSIDAAYYRVLVATPCVSAHDLPPATAAVSVQLNAHTYRYPHCLRRPWTRGLHSRRCM